MGNLNLYPLERNKYFYGKLLTVRDFQTEQQYNTDKQRMMSRVMYGAGVISGLKAVMIDEQTVFIEKGVALDNLGREIVVSKSITQKLSLIDGFDDFEDAESLYICLHYNEKGKERIHAISNEDSGEDGGNDYNRIEETYALKLVRECDLSMLFGKTELNQVSRLIYEDDKAIIRIVHPKYMNPGDIFFIEAEILKKSMSSSIDLTLEIKSKDLKPVDYEDIELDDEGNQKILIRFKDTEEELMNGALSLVKASVPVTVLSKVNADGEISIPKESVRLEINEMPFDIREDVNSSFTVTRENILEILEGQYYRKSFDDRILEQNAGCIYLARLNLLKLSKTYVIKNIEPMPFKQFVYDNDYIYNAIKQVESTKGQDLTTLVNVEEVQPYEKPMVDVAFNNMTREMNFDFKMPQSTFIYDNIMTGTYEFTFEENFKFGKNLITEELEHGLGKGPVFIHIGLEEKYDDYNDDENAIFYGDSEVFFKTEDEPQASMYTFGSVVYPKKGSFKIGMRVKNGKDGERIRLRWWAYKSMADINQKDRINIKIDPSEVELRKGEEYNFKAIITGDDTYNYRWEIEDESFGVLDEHGKLLADDTTGTFKIFAISNVDPTVRGTAFVTIYDDDAFNGLNDQVSGLGGFGVDEG